VVGPLTVTTSVGWGGDRIVIEWLPLAVFAFASVAVTDMVKLPGEAYVVVKLAPEPDALLPPVVAQRNVYGVSPPELVAVNVTAVPAVPVVGPLIVTAGSFELF
jgi:hypothetical protein